MSLAERLAEAKTAPRIDPRVKCGAKDWLDTLPQAEQDAAAELLASSLPSTDLWDDFRAEGFPLQYNALRRHRAGECSCVSR